MLKYAHRPAFHFTNHTSLFVNHQSIPTRLRLEALSYQGLLQIGVAAESIFVELQKGAGFFLADAVLEHGSFDRGLQP